MRGWIILSGVDCFKPIIINKMILGREIASVKIADQPNRFGVDGRHAHKLGTARAWLPFRNLVPVL
jgi:hypothetical protein